jgi:hypothetical protein
LIRSHDDDILECELVNREVHSVTQRQSNGIGTRSYLSDAPLVGCEKGKGEQKAGDPAVSDGDSLRTEWNDHQPESVTSLPGHARAMKSLDDAGPDGHFVARSMRQICEVMSSTGQHREMAIANSATVGLREDFCYLDRLGVLRTTQ